MSLQHHPPSREDFSVLRVEHGRALREEHDAVVVEAPLEVRVGERSLLVTMRTPGRDADLVRGLLYTEALVEQPGDVTAVKHCRDVPDDARGHVVVVSLRQGVELDEEHTVRVGLVTSGCGVCGKATLEAVSATCSPVAPGPRVRASVLSALPDVLRAEQDLFARTGGLHAAGLFSANGKLLALAEDVGRHNAVDKVIGEAARFGRLPLSECLMLVSGRAGFEIVQKTRRAGIPILASVSAPSSLAVTLASDGGQTLVGFLRPGRFNVYCGAERLELDG
ncbi:MAG: sulfurtransferase FdhD [Planctomycetota bacterium]|nr:MAG: sulfurtransferase FdhD [Planctomycetota bacterium]